MLWLLPSLLLLLWLLLLLLWNTTTLLLLLLRRGVFSPAEQCVAFRVVVISLREGS